MIFLLIIRTLQSDRHLQRRCSAELQLDKSQLGIINFNVIIITLKNVIDVHMIFNCNFITFVYTSSDRTLNRNAYPKKKYFYYSPERKKILNKQYVSLGLKHNLFLDFLCKT